MATPFRNRRQSSITPGSAPPLAHVHLRPILNLSPSLISNVSKSCVYDDTHKQLLVVADNKLLFWNLPEISAGQHHSQQQQQQGQQQGAPSRTMGAASRERSDSAAGKGSMGMGMGGPASGLAPDAVVSPQVCFLSQGPVITARFSPDRKILAVQRTDTEIEFVNQEDGSQFWQKCKGTSRLGFGSETKLLGFFWCSNMSNLDIVFVTTGGLELYKLLGSKKGLQLKEVKKHSIKWYKYTADTKLVIIATGEDCSRLFGYQFAPQGLIKLPRFDVDLQSGTDKGSQDSNYSPGAKKEALTPESIHPIALYGKLYCCHINSVAERVVLYRLYKDAIIKQYSYPTYSRHMGISVVDNLLLVHHMNSGIVMIFDIMTNNMQPFVSPLPVLCKGTEAMGTMSPQPSKLADPPQSHGAIGGAATPAGAPSTGGGAESAPQGGEAGDELNPFKVGNKVVCVAMSNFLLALDAGSEMVWRIDLDLNAITMSCPNRLHTISFLHRRSETRHPRRNPKDMIIATVKTMVQEHENLSTLKHAFEIICFVIASSPGCPLLDGTQSPQQGSPSRSNLINSGALELEQLYEQIFESLFEDQAVELDFLFRAMETFYLCSISFHLKLPTCYFALMIDMLLAMEHFEVLTQYLSGHFFEDSCELAAKLEALGKAHYPHLSQHAVDMYFRLKEYDRCCRLLFQQGRLIDALRMLKDYHLSTIAPATFLSAAAETQDPLVYASVYRFCKEFVPGFDTLSEAQTSQALLYPKGP